MEKAILEVTEQKRSVPAARKGGHWPVALTGGVFILLVLGLAARYFSAKTPPPSEAQVHWQKAQELIADREFSEATSHLARCLASWPYNAEAHFLMARCSRRAGNLAEWKVELARAEALRWPKDQIT